MARSCRIDTVKQFIDANLSWGRESTPPQFEEYFNLEARRVRETVAEQIRARGLGAQSHSAPAPGQLRRDRQSHRRRLLSGELRHRRRAPEIEGHARDPRTVLSVLRASSSAAQARR
ncbi:unnamed protein product [Trichogramma brassicae]|uniref:Uncharacterized protein n=1 Tax=Trichogramma brassicae TaxID=86971 RepID=A0A6H5HXW8_9HYME|nr:unnamed protein product [Trichogramma brassicae]